MRRHSSESVFEVGGVYIAGEELSPEVGEREDAVIILEQFSICERVQPLANVLAIIAYVDADDLRCRDNVVGVEKHQNLVVHGFEPRDSLNHLFEPVCHVVLRDEGMWFQSNYIRCLRRTTNVVSYMCCRHREATNSVTGHYPDDVRKDRSGPACNRRPVAGSQCMTTSNLRNGRRGYYYIGDKRQQAPATTTEAAA